MLHGLAVMAPGRGTTGVTPAGANYHIQESNSFTQDGFSGSFITELKGAEGVTAGVRVSNGTDGYHMLGG